MDGSSEIDVGAFFRQRGFGARMGFGTRPALLIIDMQYAFTDPEMPLGADQSDQIRVINMLLERFRTAKAPVLFLGVSYDEPSCADAGLWRLKNTAVNTLRTGSHGTELDARLVRRGEEPLILRRYASGFFGTDLATRLVSRGIDTAVIVGCTTSGCVRATVVDALQHGFRPMVVLDAVTDRSRQAHDQSLFDIEAKYGDVVASTDVMKLLRADNGAPAAST